MDTHMDRVHRHRKLISSSWFSWKSIEIHVTFLAVVVSPTYCRCIKARTFYVCRWWVFTVAVLKLFVTHFYVWGSQTLTSSQETQNWIFNVAVSLPLTTRSIVVHGVAVHMFALQFHIAIVALLVVAFFIHTEFSCFVYCVVFVVV